MKITYRHDKNGEPGYWISESEKRELSSHLDCISESVKLIAEQEQPVPCVREIQMIADNLKYHQEGNHTFLHERDMETLLAALFELTSGVVLMKTQDLERENALLADLQDTKLSLMAEREVTHTLMELLPSSYQETLKAGVS